MATVKSLQDINGLIDKLYDGNHQPLETEIAIICEKVCRRVSDFSGQRSAIY